MDVPGMKSTRYISSITNLRRSPFSQTALDLLRTRAADELLKCKDVGKGKQGCPGGRELGSLRFGAIFDSQRSQETSTISMHHRAPGLLVVKLR